MFNEHIFCKSYSVHTISCFPLRSIVHKLNHPGVLQTQIFGAAADHWWSKGDILLSASVHRYLQSRWVSDVTSSPVCEGDPDDCPKIPGPIHTHVSRMQHAPRRNGEIDSHSMSTDVLSSSLMMDYHGQIVRLHPNAWEELGRRAHVLIPDLFPSSAAGLTESSGFRGLTEIVQLVSTFPGFHLPTPHFTRLIRLVYAVFTFLVMWSLLVWSRILAE